ncbi:META domain-containing protein [bacterium]|nr:META domain-containing protein [bacterium]
MKNWRIAIIAMSLFACKSAEKTTDQKVEEKKTLSIEKPIKASAGQGNEWNIWFFSDNTATFKVHDEIVFENHEIITTPNESGNKKIIRVHDFEPIKMLVSKEECIQEGTGNVYDKVISIQYASDEYRGCYIHMEQEFNENEKWDLTFITGMDRKMIYDLSTRPFVKLSSENKRISGNNSCNSFNGDYKTKAGKISFGQMVQTKRGCPENSIEEQFMEAMTRTNNISREDYLLKFLEGEDVLLEFRLSE